MLSLLFISQSFAWNHTYRIWSRDSQLPLKWYMSDYVTSSLDEDYQLNVITESYNNWKEDVPCAQLEYDYQGILDGHADCSDPSDEEECDAQRQTDTTYASTSNDMMNVFYYDDPENIQAGGVLGVTYTRTSGAVAFRRDGKEYYFAIDSDIVFSKNVPWISSPDMTTGCDGTPIEAVATHEIGHQLGMGHSCEENDVTSGNCDGDDLFSANMFWAAPSCANFDSNNVFTSDDVEGMTALYGPYATFSATTPTYGGVPLEVCFSLTSTSAIEQVSWLYGDGGSDDVTIESEEDYEICHTYEEKGQYSVNVTILGENEDCGEWEYTDRERAMVVVCEQPAPADGFDGMFTYTGDEGLIYQMINQADTSVYGCIDRVSWDVFDAGSGELIKVSVLGLQKIEFPEEGSYRVVLNLGGPGGIYAEELTIDAKMQTEQSCSSANAQSSMWLMLLGLLPVALRRRIS